MKTLFLALIILFTGEIFASTYYIDSREGNDNNNGTDKNNPWSSFRNISTTYLMPGDSVLLKKGSQWNETLFITGKGQKNNPIIFSSYSKGEMPVIDLQGKSLSGVLIKNSSGVIVEGLNILNPGKDSCNIKIVNSDDCIIRNCKLFNTARAGIFAEKCSRCVFQGNTITAPSEMIPDQSDGIYAQRNDGNIYDNNNIVDRNLSPEQHSDCIQLFEESNATVKNNYLEQDNPKTANAQGLYCTTSFGNHYYYNNIIYAPHSKAQLLGFFNLKKGNGRVFAFNNTVVGSFMNCFRTDDTRPVVKNNIFITRGSYSMVRFENPLSDSADINNNIYFTKYDKPIFYIDKEYTFSDWQKMGKESEGMNKDPELTADYKPMPGSPCINSGADLSIIFHEDKTGAERSNKKKFDIGAYEYKKQ